MTSMTLLFSVLSWYDCMLKCTFIWVNHCLSFFLILLNWLDFSVFSCCCWCCFSSCSMHDCIWIKICAELLDDSATLNVMSLELLNVIVFVSLKCLYSVKIIFICLISDDSFSSLTLFQNVCAENCKCCEAALFFPTDQNCWDISSQNISNVIEMTQYYFLIKEINNSVVNQTQIITISQAHLARVLGYCKSDQILESHYQWQEEMLRQEKYKNIAK